MHRRVSLNCSFNYAMDLVAVWNLKLTDGVHKVEFEHGTTTGKRMIRVDGKEILRTEWMFRLVGQEEFKIGSTKCVIIIEPADGFAYTYQLNVNGKPLEKFSENQSKILRSWVVKLDSVDYRVTMEKSSLDVYVNGKLAETAVSD